MSNVVENNELVQLHPLDEHNRMLADNVRPPTWQNTEPHGPYHLVVIGAGTAGLVTAAGAAGLGVRVALVERELMGGDCLNVGCVPSKSIIQVARIAASVRDADGFGIQVPPSVNVDFAVAMQRLRRLRAQISPADSAQRFAGLGVDVYFGQAEFAGGNEIHIATKNGSTTLQYKKAVIATGARASAPNIPGLDTVPYLTNENLFSLTSLPPGWE